MSVDFENSQTRINLMKAFAGECQARTRYDFAAEKAKKMGCYFIGNIFTITAKQEKEHAEIFWNHLKTLSGKQITVEGSDYPVANYEKLDELLRAAEKGENNEVILYNDFARIAKEEGFPDIAFSFEKIAAIEHEHENKFACFAELMESCRLFEGTEDTEWFCLNCGHVHKGKNAPKQCPVCQHEQGYFVPYKYYQFTAEKYAI